MVADGAKSARPSSANETRGQRTPTNHPTPPRTLGATPIEKTDATPA